MNKRRWEDRTELEEMLISIIQDIGRAVDAEDEEELVSLLEDKVDALEHTFAFIPWEFPHCVNDATLPPQKA